LALQSFAYAKVSKSISAEGLTITKKSEVLGLLPFYYLVDKDGNEIAQIHDVMTADDVTANLKKAQEGNRKIKVVTDTEGTITALQVTNTRYDDEAVSELGGLSSCKYADDAYAIGRRIQTKCGSTVSSRPVQCIDSRAGLVSFTSLCESDGSISADDCVKQKGEVITVEAKAAPEAKTPNVVDSLKSGLTKGIK
jgi:hypothetical protein